MHDHLLFNERLHKGEQTPVNLPQKTTYEGQPNYAY